MSRRFGILVLAAGFVAGFAAAALFLMPRVDDTMPQSRGPSVPGERRGQERESSHVPQPRAYSYTANRSQEDSPAPVSHQISDDGTQSSGQGQNKEGIRLMWGGLIDELGLNTERANELMKLYLNTQGAEREARLREELGDAGYQAYLDYLPTLTLRGQIVSFKNELAQRNIPLDRETEQKLLEIIREERAALSSERGNQNRSEQQIRERIYRRASEILSGESLAVLKTSQQNTVAVGLRK